MLDQSHVGRVLDPIEIEIEKGELIRFARALGETNPIYFDESAARKAGFRSIVAMPTFPVVPGARDEWTWGMIRDLGVNPLKLLHGSQSYVQHQPICAGDVLKGTKTITRLYSKKNLDFIDTVVSYRNPRGELVCEDQCTFVIRP